MATEMVKAGAIEEGADLVEVAMEDPEALMTARIPFQSSSATLARLLSHSLPPLLQPNAERRDPTVARAPPVLSRLG